MLCLWIKENIAWKVAPFVDLVKGEKWKSFQSYGMIRPTKFSFFYIFANWVRVYRKVHTLSMIDFINWLFVRKER